ncbi:MAG: hypothetical protein A2289_17250 [Deltaproteobacteria bacterium RIFOXYA12_FULL_58_15]|nr:MAG: hypothetical protein A2289_17250 [Deltaproteobacteria bacterium RIFOXYA12_FULL_58_15]
MAKRLETLNIAIRRLGEDISPADAIGAFTAALVLVQPLGKRNMTQAIGEIRDAPKSKNIPVFVAAFDMVSDKEARRFYEAGATAVFQWPREALCFPRLLAEVIGIHEVRGTARNPDVAVARAVRARLRLTNGLAAPLRLNVSHGVFRLEGEVDRLWKKDAIEELVALVPGVTGVFTEKVRVGPSGLSDQEIGQSVESLLRTTTTGTFDTIAVSVENGSARLAGSIDSKIELRRIVDLIKHVNGVRSVETLVTVSPSQRRSDRSLANRINKGLFSIFANPSVTVLVFGNIAVVSGNVRSLATKRKILRYLDGTDGVERLVDKVVVR